MLSVFECLSVWLSEPAKRCRQSDAFECHMRANYIAIWLPFESFESFQSTRKSIWFWLSLKISSIKRNHYRRPNRFCFMRHLFCSYICGSVRFCSALKAWHSDQHFWSLIWFIVSIEEPFECWDSLTKTGLCIRCLSDIYAFAHLCSKQYAIKTYSRNIYR